MERKQGKAAKKDYVEGKGGSSVFIGWHGNIDSFVLLHGGGGKEFWVSLAWWQVGDDTNTHRRAQSKKKVHVILIFKVETSTLNEGREQWELLCLSLISGFLLAYVQIPFTILFFFFSCVLPLISSPLVFTWWQCGSSDCQRIQIGITWARHLQLRAHTLHPSHRSSHRRRGSTIGNLEGGGRGRSGVRGGDCEED